MAEAAASPGTAPACRDCGTAAPGRYCPACGQKTAIGRNLSAMVVALIHHLTHIDGKLARTLPLLTFRPGMLTREYIRGRRTRYVEPGVIFLGSAFAMFLSFNLLPGPPAALICNPGAPSAVRQVGSAMRGDLEHIAPGVGELLPSVAPASPTPAVAWIERHAPPALLARMEKALANPVLAFSTVKQKAYKLGFLLVPLSLPALWLLVGRRPGVRPFDLAVFSLYSIGFMSVLLTAVVVLAGLGPPAWWFWGAVLLIVPPLHFFVHLRDSFALTTGETLWRTAVLCVVAIIALSLFLLMVLAWGILA